MMEHIISLRIPRHPADFPLVPVNFDREAGAGFIVGGAIGLIAFTVTYLVFSAINARFRQARTHLLQEQDPQLQPYMVFLDGRPLHHHAPHPI